MDKEKQKVPGRLPDEEELKEHGGFRLSEAQEQRIERLVSESNSVREFVTNCVAADELGQVTTEGLVEGYLQYCEKRGWSSLPSRRVERELPGLMKEIHQVTKSNDLVVGMGVKRGYRGFIIREEVSEIGN